MEEQVQENQEQASIPSNGVKSDDRFSAALAILEAADAKTAEEPSQKLNQVDSDGKPEKEAEAAPPNESKATAWSKVAELDKQNRELKQKLKDYEASGNIKDLAKKDLEKALEQIGVSFDDIINHWSNQSAKMQQPASEPEQNPELSSLRQELNAIKDELRKADEARKGAESQAFIHREKESFNKLVLDNPERFEYIDKYKDEGAYDLALSVAVEMYKLNQRIPSHEEVLDAVESQLEEMAVKHWERFSKIKKFNKQFEQGKRESPKIMTAKTLSAQAPDTPAPRELTREDRFNRAMKLLEEADKKRNSG